MRSPEIKTYSPPFELNKPMVSHGIARVLKSDAEGYHEGDIIAGPISIAQHSTRVIEPNTHIRKVDTVSGAPDVRDNIGALGMPGPTAYASLYEIGKPKKCETIFISSAGAVGQIVGQIAKREGLKVIGSVGSGDKLNLILNELSFNVRSLRSSLCITHSEHYSQRSKSRTLPDDSVMGCNLLGFSTTTRPANPVRYLLMVRVRVLFSNDKLGKRGIRLSVTPIIEDLFWSSFTVEESLKAHVSASEIILDMSVTFF
jgi:hypothetical protein